MRYTFLLWNLFLAWVPFQVSQHLTINTNKNDFKTWMLIAGWLLFFPNALYIITDLIHLDNDTNVPVWFDAIFIFTSSVLGLLMAFASLSRVEFFLRGVFGNTIVNKLVILIIFLGSFGVYLGRFQRWNSWDIVSSPSYLIKEIAVRFIFPFEHYRTWGVTLLLTCLFSLLYYTLKQTSGFVKNPDAVKVYEEI